MRPNLFPLERRVKSHAGGSEFQLPYQGQGFRGALLPVHAIVFPLNAERPAIAHVVQRPEHALERDSASAWGNKVPTASMIAEEEM